MGLAYKVYRPCVIVLAGMPLTGKNTVAQELVSVCSNLRHLDIDEVRAELFPKTERAGALEVLQSDDRKNQVSAAYDQMCLRAGVNAMKGQSVVITGTFSRDEFKTGLRQLANELQKEGIPLFVFQLSAADDEIARRIEKRQQEGAQLSINSMEKFQWAKSIFGPIDFVKVIEIDTTKKTPPDCADEVIEHLSSVINN